MEQILTRYILPDLGSNEPGMRSRACQVYCDYADQRFEDTDHKKNLVIAMFNLMALSQPLPVKFYAANALEKVIFQNEDAMEFTKPGLGTVLKCYLNLMNEMDNEELVHSFENIIVIFKRDIQPYAVEICQQLKLSYVEHIRQDKANAHDQRSIWTAVASFTSMRRILEACKNDPALIREVEKTLHECISHSLTVDGLVSSDSINEGLECIGLILYYGYENQSLSDGMWQLYPQLVNVCTGRQEDWDGQFVYDYSNPISAALKNYIARDPEGMLGLDAGSNKTRLSLACDFIGRCLEINRSGLDHMNSVEVIGVVLALLENMGSKLGDAFQPLL